MTDLLPDGTHNPAPIPEHRQSPLWRALEARYLTGQPPTDEQRAITARLRSAILDVAWLIETQVPAGRHKSLALTHLEDVQMRANRALHAEPEGVR